MIDEVGMQGEELRKGRTTTGKPPHRSKYEPDNKTHTSTEKRETLSYKNIHMEYIMHLYPSYRDMYCGSGGKGRWS